MKKGFTILEIMIVIVLIGILYSVISFNGGFAVNKASQTAVSVDMGVYEVAISDVIYDNDICTIEELVKILNENIEGQFRVKQVGSHIESINRVNKNGENYEIYTNDFLTYKLVCGEEEKYIEVMKR